MNMNIGNPHDILWVSVVSQEVGEGIWCCQAISERTETRRKTSLRPDRSRPGSATTRRLIGSLQDGRDKLTAGVKTTSFFGSYIMLNFRILCKFYILEKMKINNNTIG